MCGRDRTVAPSLSRADFVGSRWRDHVRDRSHSQVADVLTHDPSRRHSSEGWDLLPRAHGEM